MNIDWSSLGLVAITTVVAAVAVVGIFSLGVLSLSAGVRRGATASPGSASTRPALGGTVAGYACIGVSAALVLYGLYLIIPQFH